MYDRVHKILPRLTLLSILASPAVSLASPPTEVQQGGIDPKIWNGDATEPCAWPTVVRVTGANALCTGTLIHPKVVMYAAHCGAQDKIVRFGDTDNTGKTMQVEYCKTNPAYSGTSQSNDWAYCVLQQEVTEIPFTPVGYGCEVDQYYGNGASVAVVGFGNDTGTTGAGTKRWGFTTISDASGTRFDVGGNQSTTICSGDSGGPAFIRYDDQTWHVYGIASTKNDDTCTSAKGTHSLAVNAVEWIEQDSGIDVTVCHDINGNWDPGPLCGNFFNGQPALSYGSWYTWCEDTTALEWSSTCGPDFYSEAYEANPPQLEIVNPVAGQVFTEDSLMLDVTVVAQDDSGLAVDVQLEVSGMLQSLVVSESPAVFGATFPAGEYTVIAHGTDFWGNVAQSQPVSFSVGDSGGDGDGDDDGDGDSEGEEEEEGGDTDEPPTTGEDETGGFEPAADSDGGCTIAPAGRGGAWLGLGLFVLVTLRRRSR